MLWRHRDAMNHLAVGTPSQLAGRHRTGIARSDAARSRERDQDWGCEASHVLRTFDARHWFRRQGGSTLKTAPMPGRSGAPGRCDRRHSPQSTRSLTQ